MGVSAAYDFCCGLVKSNAFVAKRRLEWAYRLAKEPMRLWRRYLKFAPIRGLGVSAADAQGALSALAAGRLEHS